MMSIRYPIAALGITCAVLAGSLVLLTAEREVGGFPADTSVAKEIPPFEMTREVTTEEGVTLYHLVYESRDAWKETVVASTGETGKVGTYQELRAGKYISLVKGQEIAVDPPPGATVPGPWFGTPEWFMRRARAASGAAISTETRGRDQVLVAASGNRIIEQAFDSSSGIPVEYREVLDGKTIVHHRVTSLVRLDTQETLR